MFDCWPRQLDWSIELAAKLRAWPWVVVWAWGSYRYFGAMHVTMSRQTQRIPPYLYVSVFMLRTWGLVCFRAHHGGRYPVGSKVGS